MNPLALVTRCLAIRPKKIHLAVPLLMMAVLYWLSSVPGVPVPDAPEAYALVSWVPPTVQNVLHIPVYAALAWAWHWALGAWIRKLSLQAIAACGIASAYGVFDEWHQGFVPGRYASLTDAALDLAGAALGIWLAAWASRYSARISAACDKSD
jgi:hypothetical protein